MFEYIRLKKYFYQNIHNPLFNKCFVLNDFLYVGRVYKIDLIVEFSVSPVLFFFGPSRSAHASMYA